MTTTEIHGQHVGRIYIIVGTDRLGLATKLAENHAFALELQGQLEALYPDCPCGSRLTQLVSISSYTLVLS